MDAGQLKEVLTANDIVDLLHELGAEPKYAKGEIHSRTVCHGGHKHKLIYYIDSQTFTCFTDDCGRGFDIYSLIEKVYGVDFSSAFKYVAGKFGLSTEFDYTPGNHVDTAFIRKFRKKESIYELNEIPTNLLNSFYNLGHISWLDDGISMKSMKKFNIMYSIKENKIIIPHFNVHNKLLGIRGRALNQEEIDAGKKYMPVYHKGEVRKHPTGANIYGINKTREHIMKYKTIVIFESEKGVLQLDTMFPEASIGGAISGSSLTDEQVRILKENLDVENVVIALDKEFEKANTDEDLFYREKVKSGFIDKLVPYFHVQVLWDKHDLLDLKDSPTDKGKEIFQKLWETRIFIA